ncbi:MAG TPA: hypothetical protein DCO82_08365 [Alphaproteobacteria bacterium]|nr:hypothetical protein [Alphaproteobacteria bacterium]
MDENTQQRIWRALDDAMQLLEQSPEKFAGIVLSFGVINDNGGAMELRGKSVVCGYPELLRRAKADLEATLERSGDLNGGG